MLRVLVVEVPGKPPLANQYRRMHPMARAALDREWRGWARYAALAAKPGHELGLPWQRVEVTVAHVLGPGTRRCDTGACAPAAKAAIDGIVDAGILPGDGPDVIASLCFLAPAKGERDELVITLRREMAGEG